MLLKLHHSGPSSRDLLNSKLKVVDMTRNHYLPHLQLLLLVETLIAISMHQTSETFQEIFWIGVHMNSVQKVMVLVPASMSLPQKTFKYSHNRQLLPFLTQCRTLLSKLFVIPATLLPIHNQPLQPDWEHLTSMVQSASKRTSNSVKLERPERDPRVLQKSLEFAS